MKLSKIIPARRKTVKFLWCKKDYLEMSERFREIRGRCASPMDSCFWCNHKFADGEMMALACPEKGRNKMLCQDCASKLVDRGSNGLRKI